MRLTTDAVSTLAASARAPRQHAQCVGLLTAYGVRTLTLGASPEPGTRVTCADADSTKGLCLPRTSVSCSRLHVTCPPRTHVTCARRPARIQPAGGRPGSHLRGASDACPRPPVAGTRRVPGPRWSVVRRAASVRRIRLPAHCARLLPFDDCRDVPRHRRRSVRRSARFRPAGCSIPHPRRGPCIRVTWPALTPPVHLTDGATSHSVCAQPRCPRRRSASPLSTSRPCGRARRMPQRLRCSRGVRKAKPTPLTRRFAGLGR